MASRYRSHNIVTDQYNLDCSLIASEKELCETLQLKKGTMKSEFDDIRHRLTFLEKVTRYTITNNAFWWLSYALQQCLENGLLDFSVKQTDPKE